MRTTRILVVGVGSRLRGDDAAGPLTVDVLRDMLEREGHPPGTEIHLIDADVMPENYTKPIRESGADAVFFIDAVDLGLPPGEVRIVPPERIDACLPSTHTLPMSHVMAYIKEAIPRVDLIGVQIRSAGLFEEMSEEVREACSRLAGTIMGGGWRGIPSA